MNENIERLLALIKENPDLPIVPMVDAEIVAGDDFGRWMGSWGYSKVDAYLIPPKNYEAIIYKSDDDVFDTLEKVLPEAEFNALQDVEAECRKAYDALPWVKAIMVNIDLPD